MMSDRLGCASDRLIPGDCLQSFPSLEAGSIVLSGGLTASTELRPGSVASAEFDGLGTVRIHCC